MEFSLATIEEFRMLFTGNTEAHGVHLNDPDEVPDANGKLRGKNFTEVNPVTQEMYMGHLGGGRGLGIVPVDQQGKVWFTALDVDMYGTDHAILLTAIYKYNFPCVPFRSKSGGLHLYTFFKSPTDAELAITFTNDLKRMLALEKKVETFPKQSELKSGTIGNWINIPYYDATDTKQYAIARDGSSLQLPEALDLCASKRIDMEEANLFLANAPLSDGPPCLQAIYIRGDTINRNDYLFSLAVYYKAKMGDDFEYAVAEANSNLSRPIEIDRLSSTVISSHKKKNYTYGCSKDPIVSLCSRAVCKKRKYGIGGSEISDLSYEEFTQYKTDPPYYEWRVDGHSLKFFKESDIIQQSMFRELCFRNLHKLPMKLSDVAWTQVINTALSNVIIQEVEKSEDVSTGSIFYSYVAEFMTKRAKALTKEHIAADRVYVDTELNAYIFKPKNLLIFLIRDKQFRAYSLTEIQDKLIMMGAQATRYFVSSEIGSLRAWLMPMEALKDYVDVSIEHLEVDFMEALPDEAY